MASIEIEKLVKTFGHETVVHAISLAVADGEFVVLVGPSGCGKSTTLRMIAGLEAVDGGTIRIGREVVNTVHPADRDVAMVFQSYALYPHMSVRDNLAYGLKRRGLPRAEIAARVDEVAKMLRLDALLHRRPAQLSGGQRQRVALGRAIVRKPAVFLMDEPLSNLDAKLRVEMRGELMRLHAELGVTTVYVTHDQVEAMTMGARIVVMNHGRIEQIGTPLEVYRAPASLFVARFLGLPEINLLEGHLRPVAAGAVFETADLHFPVAHPCPAGPVVAGLRPQALFGTPGTPDPDATLLGTAVVGTVEHHGPESFAACRMGSTELTLRIAPGAEVHPGSRLAVTLGTDAPHLFDPASGRRLEPSGTPA